MIYEESSVLITGASQGIGRSIAITFASLTSRPLALLARNRENLRETSRLCKKEGARDVVLLECDASDPHRMENLEFPDDFPEPGILINNAGSFLMKPLAETTIEEYRKEMDANLFTAVNTVNRFLPAMHRLDRGMIINICSVGALKGLAHSGAYSSAKHALLGYTRSLRAELKATHIGVTAINLGQTHSQSWDESDMSPERLINPSDIASLLVVMSQFSPRTIVEEVILEPQHGQVPPV